MREYLLRRLLLLIPTLLGVTFIVFLMMHFIPGDPVTNMMGETYSADDAQKLRHELGLDQPMVVQYGKYLTKNNFILFPVILDYSFYVVHQMCPAFIGV